MKKSKGFSLVELIVVITIIAVITAIGTVSFAGSNKKARDSKRLADLERIRMALEVVRQVGNTYPQLTNPAVDTFLVSSGYLSQYPVGPKGDAYTYERQTDYSYFLYAQMETGVTTPYVGHDCGTGITCNYQVQQP
jgi:prepilin-type N-terminal cleavage/methylation domain-containing protein